MLLTTLSFAVALCSSTLPRLRVSSLPLPLTSSHRHSDVQVGVPTFPRAVLPVFRSRPSLPLSQVTFFVAQSQVTSFHLSVMGPSSRHRLPSPSSSQVLFSAVVASPLLSCRRCCFCFVFFFIGGKMLEDVVYQHPLYGGKIFSIFPHRLRDVNNIRDVPNHQEVFADPSRDESLIFELLDFKPDVADNGSAGWFLRDLAIEQDAEGSVVIEQSAVLDEPGLMYINMPVVVTTVVGQMAISKGRQGREA